MAYRSTMWYQAICPFEGARDTGEAFRLYFEWNDEIDEHLLWNHLLENQQKIDAFVEHSMDTETIQKVGEVSEEQIQGLVADLWKPDYALFQDGRVYKMKYVDECCWVETD